MKPLYNLIIGIIACGIVFYLAYAGDYFGKFIDRFFPCTQNPMNSFPCFGVYDFYVMILAGATGLILLGFLIFKLTHK